jgi:hypothetical protein
VRHARKQAYQSVPPVGNDHVLRIELDQMVSPPTLHVATWGGAAAIRKLP